MDEQNNQGDEGTESQGLTQQEALSKISLIRADKTHFYNTPSPWDHRANQAAKDEVEGLYRVAYPESDSRKAELPENRTLHDRIREIGFKSPEEIEQMGEEGREKIAIERVEREATRVETQLKIELGQEEFESTVNTGRFVLDKILSPKDKALLIERYGNDPDFIKWLGQAGRFFDNDDFWKGEAKKYQRRENNE